MAVDMAQTDTAKETSDVRVLVVDDSAVVRGLITRTLDEAPGITVVGSAANGQLGLNELKRKEVDVVVLDIEMPVMDGLTALSHITADYPATRVIMASTLTLRNAEISLKAMNLGAADYVPKPESGLGSAEEFKRELIEKVKALGGFRARKRSGTTRGAGVDAPAEAAAAMPAITSNFKLLAHELRPKPCKPTVLLIGSSTGGPPALQSVFAALKGHVQQPILLTQHMPATFTRLLAEQLTRVGGRPCTEAVDGEVIKPGHCYVAPGGWHMVVDTEAAHPILRLNQEPPENFCRPAVDPLFRTAAKVYGAGVLAVILTGMGHDGARGCETIHQNGGRFIAQDEATSAVWGMPGAAAATGLAHEVLPIDEIGPWLRQQLGAAK
jgi:two-component system, chemotaxis family, protein-glutamate methylesterase/glutaminase